MPVIWSFVMCYVSLLPVRRIRERVALRGHQMAPSSNECCAGTVVLRFLDVANQKCLFWLTGGFVMCCHCCVGLLPACCIEGGLGVAVVLCCLVVANQKCLSFVKLSCVVSFC